MRRAGLASTAYTLLRSRDTRAARANNTGLITGQRSTLRPFLLDHVRVHRVTDERTIDAASLLGFDDSSTRILDGRLTARMRPFRFRFRVWYV